MTPRERGCRLYAESLSRRGEVTKAQAYLASKRLSWPPFPSGEVAPAPKPPVMIPPPAENAPVSIDDLRQKMYGVTPDEEAKFFGSPSPVLSDGAAPSSTPAVPQPKDVAEQDATEDATPVAVVPSESLSADVHGVPREAATGLVFSPDETHAAAPVSSSAVLDGKPGPRLARVMNYCVNPRLCGVKFEDGNRERASLWVHRNFKINETVTVEVERGIPGVNAIYQETRTRT